MNIDDSSQLVNAFYGREARFEIKKIENTLPIPLRLKNAMISFHCKYFKIAKNHVDFTQNLFWEMSEAKENRKTYSAY